MKVFLLGQRGMLGHVVARYLAAQGHEVATSELRYTGAAHDPLVEAARASGCEWIVNAAGVVPQRTPASGDMLLVNARLPVDLARRLGPGQRLVHASSDCVFSGARGGYRVDDERDATDAYGLSKIQGEAAAAGGRCAVLRTSIIGPQAAGAHGLMAWFLAQRGTVDGYTNHRWNGVTTLQWAKLCASLIDGRLASAPIAQAACAAALSKYELLRLIAAAWPAQAGVRPAQAPQPVDRTLVPQIACPPIEEQLAELRAWYQA